MLVTLSPAKIQNFTTKATTKISSRAEFEDEANYLIDYLKDYDSEELGRLLGINPKQAIEVYQWTQGFNLERTPQKQAVFTYNGMVFLGLHINSFSAEDIAYTQDHLVLFSALYGVLRPLDLIKPYRLDLITKLSSDRGTDLYAFWRKNINETFRKRLEETGGVWVNLASNEFSKIIERKALPKGTKSISVVFKEQRADGTQKQIVVYTKKARGMMAQFILKNRLEDMEDIKAFEEEGYQFSPSMSNNREWIFTR